MAHLSLKDDTVGDRIRASRKILSEKLGRQISQLDLSEMCGWPGSQGRLSKYERNAINISMAVIEVIADNTGVRPEWIAFKSLPIFPMSHVIPDHMWKGKNDRRSSDRRQLSH